MESSREQPREGKTRPPAAQAFDDTEEPSPINRRIIEGRSYNDGNWSSSDLAKLYSAIAKYGTKPTVLPYFSKVLLPGKTQEQITTKLIELRELISEHRDDAVNYRRAKWLNRGADYRNVEPDPSFVEFQRNEFDWLSLISLVNSERPFLSTNVVREAAAGVFEEVAATAPVGKDVKVSDFTTSSLGDESRAEELSWQRVYAFVASAMRLNSPLPPVNHIEAAVILKVMDNIEDEAYQASDRDKSVMKGLRNQICMNEMPIFEPDFPITLQAARQALLDPLRTRLWQVPVNGAEPVFADNFDKMGSSPSGVSLLTTVERQLSDSASATVHPVATTELPAADTNTNSEVSDPEPGN